jgi:hypothetical protein
MKSIMLLLFAAFFYTSSFANDEDLSVLRDDGTGSLYWEYDNFNGGRCQPYNFRVQYTIPSGYASVKQFDWYVNGVFIKTTTQTSNIDGRIYGVTELVGNNPAAKFVCKVIYQTSQGVASNPYPSEEFVISSDVLGFILDGPSSVNVGNQTVSYVLTPNGGLGTYNPPVGTYTVAWEGPSGWTLGSVTNGGLNASFAADNASGGTVKATITLNGGCGYKDSKSKNVVRIYPAPGFSSPNPSRVCASSPSGTFTINAQPLAASYTYTIHPSYGSGSGITFAANGQQMFTTTATSVTINCNTSEDHILFLGVVANYNGGVSSEATMQINYLGTTSWNPDITFIPGCMQACNDNTPVEFQATAPWIMGATYYWYMDGFLVDLGASEGTALWWQGESLLQVKAVTECWSSNIYSEAFPISCFCDGFTAAADNSLSVYPNPAQNEVTVSLKTINANNKKGKLTTIKEVKISDKFGTVKKYSKYPPNTRTATINIGALPADVYTIEVSDGVNKVNRQLSKSK